MTLTRYARFLPSNLTHLRTLTTPLHSTFTTTPNHGSKPQPEPESIRPGPPPIRVGFTSSAGRGVFSTRIIQSGELIHTAHPIISHPSLTKLYDDVCYFCLRRIATPLNVGPFCSFECWDQSKVFYELEKKADWSSYHKHCRDKGLKYPLLVKRLACMVVSGAASADCIDILQPSHILPETQEEFSLLRSTIEAINISDDNLKFLTRQWYDDVLARIRINAFRIEIVAGSYGDLLSSAAASVDAEAGVGNGVYILPSFYNHDCDPNVHIIWIDNVNARLNALRDIDEGEELHICYIDASMDKEARQNVLLRGFGFECSCPRCLSGD